MNKLSVNFNFQLWSFCAFSPHALEATFQRTTVIRETLFVDFCAPFRMSERLTFEGCELSKFAISLIFTVVEVNFRCLQMYSSSF